jgi:hypothetical protein
MENSMNDGSLMPPGTETLEYSAGTVAEKTKMEINMALSKILYYAFILITVLFIAKMGIEFLNCIQLVENTYAPDPVLSESSYKYFIEENRVLTDKIITLVQLSTCYGILTLIYFFSKNRKP